MLIPVLLIGLGGVAAYKAGKKLKVRLTPEREMILKSALNLKLDSSKYNELADAFEKEGLTAEATLLRKRAKLRDLPEETKASRRAIIKKAMASTNVNAIECLADAFEKEGAVGTAADLRRYAEGLTKAGPQKKADTEKPAATPTTATDGSLHTEAPTADPTEAVKPPSEAVKPPNEQTHQ